MLTRLLSYFIISWYYPHSLTYIDLILPSSVWRSSGALLKFINTTSYRFIYSIIVLLTKTILNAEYLYFCLPIYREFINTNCSLCVGSCFDRRPISIWASVKLITSSGLYVCTTEKMRNHLGGEEKYAPGLGLGPGRRNLQQQRQKLKA